MNATTRIYAICTFVIIIAIATICLSLMAAALTPVHAESLEQANFTPTVTLCSPIGHVVLAPDIAGVNVRTLPNVDAAYAADAIKPRLLPYAVDAVSEDGNWYRLCGVTLRPNVTAGWVARVTARGLVLLVFTAAQPTQTPKPTLSVTVNPITPTPTATRQASAPTFTPVTDVPRILFIDENGTPYECQQGFPLTYFAVIMNGQLIPCLPAPVLLTPTPTRIRP